MHALTPLAVVYLLATGLWAWRNLYYWYYSNGLMELLGHCIMTDRAPSGQPLKVLCTSGRFSSVDMQLKGPSIFQLLFFETGAIQTPTWAGFYFTGSFCVRGP
ncbi:hypothetical protein LTR17_027370 [Elasticomyces elasticus]|nr:hypothetical protein LTR17_027370 [Elasticomyces elasticus]